MTKSLTFLAALSASMAAVASLVSGVSVGKASDGTIRVDYTLADEAIVTVSFVYNGAPVPAWRSTLLSGDVNKLVDRGSRCLYWRADRDSFGFDAPVAAEHLTANVTAWPKSSPPPYMVCDLTCAESRMFYASAEAVPLGVTNALYKGERLVMRRMPAGGVRFRMGKYADWQYCITHRVKLSDDFYIAIYPLTRLQYYIASQQATGTGSWYGEAVDDSVYAPVTMISWLTFRGNTLWPAETHDLDTSGCPLDYLRTVTGLELDLPTDAQWEFAARINGTGTYTNIANAAATVRDKTTYGWYNHWNDGANAHPIEVGLYPPSDFGLYDLHGNVNEYCLDYLSTQQSYANHFEGIDPVVDPKGAVRADAVLYNDTPCRSLRGGPWSDGVLREIHDRKGVNQTESYAGAYNGFRLVCPLPYAQ